ncbi:glycoside hydrolase family 18 protein [Botrytis cinerea]
MTEILFLYTQKLRKDIFLTLLLCFGAMSGQCDLDSINCTKASAPNHFSNRRDVAQCGRNAPQGSQVCPLNTCCSGNGYCGTTSAYCINADPINGNAPCQRGYGACGIISFPNCGSGSTTASNGRKVSYWQIGSATRPCNALPVSLIPTQNITHLIFAFMSISPNSFHVVPFDTTAVPLMYPFTALASASLATYMAIGGGGSSVLPPIWSQMVSNQGNRAAFIGSVEGWLSTFNFQGVDLDWEFPSSDNDRDGFVALVREMRESFSANYPGKNWGISVVLPPDIYSLQFFDPINLEPYINFFNFMSYDLHGPWEASNPALGAFVRPQTSLPDITNAISPLWFAGVDPMKVNLGLAAYGRGYTLANPGCAEIGCAYTGLSEPGPCSTEAGILSMREIEVLVLREGLRATWAGASAAEEGGTAVKQIVFAGGRQWMGFDDEESWGLKRRYADQLCIGGTVVWSLDLQVVGTGDGNFGPGF